MKWINRYLDDNEHRRFIEGYNLAAGALLRQETDPRELILSLFDEEFNKQDEAWTRGVSHAASEYIRLTEE